MSNMVVTDDGKEFTLAELLAGLAADAPDLRFRLYQNNYTPVDGSTPSDFTDATFTGYAEVALSFAAGWSVSIAANIAYLTKSAPITFTCTGGSAQTIYGWYIYNADDTTVWCAQKFTTARSMTPGATESIDPTRFALKSFA